MAQLCSAEIGPLRQCNLGSTRLQNKSTASPKREVIVSLGPRRIVISGLKRYAGFGPPFVGQNAMFIGAATGLESLSLSIGNIIGDLGEGFVVLGGASPFHPVVVVVRER